MFAGLVFLTVFLILWFARGPADGPDARRLPAWVLWPVLALLLAGNRFNGADWIHYSHTYEALAGAGDVIDAIVDSPFEWLFSLLLWSMGQLAWPYEAVVLVIGLFNATCLVKVVRRIGAPHPGHCLALLLLVEGWTLYHEQLRQSLAISLCLLALLAQLDGKSARALLLWLAALGCHSSAIVAPMLLLLVRTIKRHGLRPISVGRAVLLGVLAFAFVSSLFVIVREGLIPIGALDRLRNKLELYGEHDVFGGTLFTAGMAGYLVAFVLLWASRGIVDRQRDFWLSLSWSAALLWSVVGPLLRTQAILIRFEHYLLIFLPIALALLLARMDSGAWRRRIAVAAFCLFAATFPLRVFLHPENLVWSFDYQNYLVGQAFGLELEDETLRETLICTNLALFDNDFCGRDPSGS